LAARQEIATSSQMENWQLSKYRRSPSGSLITSDDVNSNASELRATVYKWLTDWWSYMTHIQRDHKCTY